MTAADIADILEISRSWNARHDVSGMLVYYSGRFTQVLEGTETEIKALKRKIRDDPRHAEIAALFEGAQPSRIFAQWSMAYHDPEPGQQQELDATLPLDWARRTLRSIDTCIAQGAFRKMAGWIETGG